MKPVLTGTSPNAQGKDVFLALKLLLSPQKWLKGKSSKILEAKLEKYFQTKRAFTTSSGRGALKLILKAVDLKPKDEVITQGFGCIVVANAIKSAGGKPVFADVKSNGFNLSLLALKKAYTQKTRAVVVQNLFGYPDEIDSIKNWCQKKQLVLIEDCAQALGAEYQGQLLGTFGDFGFTSFGRDKMISSVNGGSAWVNNANFLKDTTREYQKLKNPTLLFVLRNLLHPLIFAFVKRVYFWPSSGKFSLGKMTLFLFQKLGLVKKAVLPQELKGKTVSDLNQKLPNAMARMALSQFERLPKNLEKRRRVAQFYFKNLNQSQLTVFRPDDQSSPSFLRVPILVSKPQSLFDWMLSKGVRLGRWYQSALAPKGACQSAVGYQAKCCPNAKKITQKIINLPTYSSLTHNQLNQIVNLINHYYEKT